MGLKRLPSRIGRPPAKVQAMPKRVESFYVSREWKQLVARLKRERGPWRERCGSGKRVVGEHKVEHRNGGAELDSPNVQLLCHACHK